MWFVCVILRFAFLVEHRLVTDRQTRTQAHGYYRECIASRGNKAHYSSNSRTSGVHEAVILFQRVEVDCKRRGAGLPAAAAARGR